MFKTIQQYWAEIIIWNMICYLACNEAWEFWFFGVLSWKMPYNCSSKSPHNEGCVLRLWVPFHCKWDRSAHQLSDNLDKLAAKAKISLRALIKMASRIRTKFNAFWREFDMQGREKNIPRVDTKLGIHTKKVNFLNTLKLREVQDLISINWNFHWYFNFHYW